MTKHAVIIGAGIGGLATANLLAHEGWQVSVYERAAGPGGRAGTMTIDGFTFDTGPSWYLMPEVFEHYFALLGKRVDDYLTLERLDPAYKVFYDYHDSLTVTSDIEQDAHMFAALEPGADQRLRTYLAQAERTYRLAVDRFLYNPFTSLRSLLAPKILRQLPFLLGQLLRPIDGYVRRFVRAKPSVQILEYPMVFLGSSPFRAPAMYHLMSHMDFKQGVWYPQGGIYKIVEALVAIGQERGVVYHYNTDVVAIETAQGRATGIRLANGEIVSADIVVSNADLHWTETKLLPARARTYPERYWRKRVAGPSALLLYLGVKGELPELVHHNLYFVDDWQTNFQAIFDSKQWPAAPSMYLCKPSATDQSVAPAGAENLFMLVPLPADPDVDGAKKEAYAAACIETWARAIGVPDLSERITVQKIYGPDDFANDYHAWQGTALGLAHELKQSALFRPRNQSKKLDNLYYVGAGTRPGIGIPMCLISAEIIIKLLRGDTSAGPLEEPTT